MCLTMCLTARISLRRPRALLCPARAPTGFDVWSSRGGKPERTLGKHPHVLGGRVVCRKAVDLVSLPPARAGALWVPGGGGLCVGAPGHTPTEPLGVHPHSCQCVARVLLFSSADHRDECTLDSPHTAAPVGGARLAIRARVLRHPTAGSQHSYGVDSTTRQFRADVPTSLKKGPCTEHTPGSLVVILIPDLIPQPDWDKYH